MSGGFKVFFFSFFPFVCVVLFELPSYASGSLFFFLLGRWEFSRPYPLFSFFFVGQEEEGKNKEERKKKKKKKKQWLLLSKRPFFLARFPRSSPHPPLWFREGGGEKSGGQTPGQKTRAGSKGSSSSSSSKKGRRRRKRPLSPLRHTFRLGPPQEAVWVQEEGGKKKILLPPLAPHKVGAKWGIAFFFSFFLSFLSPSPFQKKEKRKEKRKKINTERYFTLGAHCVARYIPSLLKDGGDGRG